MLYVLKDEGVIERCIAGIRLSLGKTVEIKTAKRSLPQNRLYWNLLNVLSKDIGMTPDELHEEIKVRFIGVETKVIAGQVIRQPISTTTLDKKQFTELIDKVYALGAELNIVLPNPAFWGMEELCTA
jgi:hypothetical protein